MNYEGRIIRPPSEADSLILQVAVGCSHNRCTFCPAYKEKKFRIKTLEQIRNDISHAASHYGADTVRRVFLCDGDPLIIPQHTLAAVLADLSSAFPHMKVDSTTYPDWKTMDGCNRCHGTLVAAKPGGRDKGMSYDELADELGGVAFKVGIHLTILDAADGVADIRALRYLRALRQCFEITRWTSGLKYQRIKQLETAGYIDTANNQSWREIGISLETSFAAY